MGLRALDGAFWRPQDKRKLLCVLLIASLCFSNTVVSGNRLPKFPSTSKAEKENKASLEPTNLRTVRSQASKQNGKNNTVQSGISQEYDKSLQDAWKSAAAKADKKPVQSAKSQEWTPPKQTSTDYNSTVLIKARLKPTDIFNKGGNKVDPHAKLLDGGKHRKTYNYTEARQMRSGSLDIVLTHYDVGRTEQMVNYWLNFLQLEKVQVMKPYVFIYCQNDKYDLDSDDFAPILQLGGEIQHLPNIGRESHAYLEHILKRYGDLANYTLFAQDASDTQLPDRFEMLFEPGRTGFLPLSVVGHVDCEDPFLPAGVIPQIYAMFANELCPPVGYTSSFEGQFIVSKTRILRNGYWTYQRLQDVLSADESHWIHQTHDNQHYKSKSNPLFGHVVERAWSVAFDCFESWREGNCWQCIVIQGMHNCGSGDCQCFDRPK